VLSPFGFRLALLVGCALARGDLVEGAPLSLYPYVGVAREHGAGDVPGDAHDHLIAGARLREFRDQGVAVVVPPALYAALLADLAPCRLERRDWARRIFGERLPEGEHKPLRPALTESPGVPSGMRLECGDGRFVQRNHTLRARLTLGESPGHWQARPDSAGLDPVDALRYE